MDEVISIELASASDAKSVITLLTEVGLPTHGVGEQIKNFLVAREDGQVIGCVGLETYGESCLLRALAVRPDFQGKGLGLELMRQIISRARQQGLKQAVILTHTVERLAAKIGFERIPRESVDPRVAQSWEFQATACQQAVCMRLNLNATVVPSGETANLATEAQRQRENSNQKTSV